MLDGDIGTFDCVHSEFTKYVNLYVPFFGFTLHVWSELRVRNPALTSGKSAIIKVLLFYMKLLAFLRTESVKNRYLDVKRIFQSDVSSEFWYNFEVNFLKDDSHVLKWNVATNSDDSKLILAINRQQEKQLLLINEQLQPTATNSDNLGNLIEGV